MGWFKRMKDNIATPTIAKKETPEGLWYQCKKCKVMMSAEEHKENFLYRYADSPIGRKLQQYIFPISQRNFLLCLSKDLNTQINSIFCLLS